MHNIPAIIVLDTHPVPRIALAALLREQFEQSPVIEARNLSEFREMKPLAGPVIFILVINSDFEEEDDNPVTELKTHYPTSFIILYGEEMKAEVIIDYLKNGANGYLSKDRDLAELISCIHTVVGGRRYISVGHMEYLFEHLIENYRTTKKQDLLTPRQREVAKLLAQGLTTSVIAEQTGLHISTISTFKTAIFSKLGIDNILKLKQILEGE